MTALRFRAVLCATGPVVLEPVDYDVGLPETGLSDASLAATVVHLRAGKRIMVWAGSEQELIDALNAIGMELMPIAGSA